MVIAAQNYVHDALLVFVIFSTRVHLYSSFSDTVFKAQIYEYYWHGKFLKFVKQTLTLALHVIDKLQMKAESIQRYNTATIEQMRR